MSRRSKPLIAALALALGASPSAQQTFRTTANVVAVDASVYDKNGQPVTDLTAADFKIFEDGVAQPVQTLYLVSADAGIVKATASPQPEAKAGEAAGTGAPVIRRELRNRVLVFVFDLNHLSADGYKRSQTAVESFLGGSALPSDMVGVVAGTVMLTNKISADKTSILDAMKSMKGPNLARYNELRAYPKLIDDAEALAIARGNKETTDRAVLRACSEQPGDCGGRGGDEIVRQQVEAKARQFTVESNRDSQLTLSTLLTLTNGLGRFPGSKQVLLLSDGFFAGELESQLKAVVELAARNNVRFSTLDSRGLGRDPRMQSMMGAQPLTAAGDMSPLSFDENTDAMASLAIDTGGELIQNHNDLKPSIDMIARTTGTYYVLGYAPSKALDGSYRRIDVKVTRPGVTVRARRGYVATATAERSLTDAEGSLTNAEGSLPGAGGSLPGAGGSLPGAGGSLPSKSVGTQPPARVSEPSAKASEPSSKVSEPSAPVSEPPAPPKVRPNSEKNVDALTRISPAGGASDAQKLADAGWAAYSKGDVATAREKLNAAVTSGPSAPWVYYALGFSEYATGHYDAALTAWDTVRARVPEFMPVYFDIADAYISLGKSTDAVATLREAVKRWPNEAEPQNALGTMLVRRGALDEAIDIFTRLTAAKPDDSLGFFNLGRAHHFRYLRLQQNVSAANLRGANAIGEDDRKKAVAAYKHYVDMGGPFVKEAKDALAILDWK